MLQSSPPILIIRLDGIGDALALTPLLAALRARGIPADLVLQRSNAGIFSSRAARRIEIVPFDLRSSTPTNIERIRTFGQQIGVCGYSHALVATEDPGGYRLARWSGAPARVGFTNGWGKPLKTLWVRSQLTQTVYRPAGHDSRGRHECEVLFELGRSLLGTEQPTHSCEQLRPLLLDEDPLRDQRVAVQITNKWQRLGVRVDELADMLQRLASIVQLRLIGSKAESEYGDAIAAAVRRPIEYFGEVNTWKVAVATARALVAPDSGATHVAGIAGTPTVAIFPVQPNFEQQVARWRPWAAPYRIVKLEEGWQRRTVAALVELM